MDSKQYRIVKNQAAGRWMLYVTLGLLDTVHLGNFLRQRDAREAALAHAAAHGWKAIILT